MRLWDEELEDYREEARSLLQFLPAMNDPVSEPDPILRVQAIRKSFRELTPIVSSEGVEETTIPGPDGQIPVRLFRPPGKARALYLQIHGDLAEPSAE